MLLLTLAGCNSRWWLCALIQDILRSLGTIAAGNSTRTRLKHHPHTMLLQARCRAACTPTRHNQCNPLLPSIRCQTGVRHATLPLSALDERCRTAATAAKPTCTDSWLPALALPGASSVLTLLYASAAMADDGLAYDPTEGSEFFKNVAGGAYVVLVVFFAYRVLSRRAVKARTEVRHCHRQHPAGC
jgi:hypothetical protein